jgi:hypothetical protein
MQFNIKAILAVSIWLVLVPLAGWSNETTKPKDGTFWVFDVKGQNPAVNRNDEANGIYTITFRGGAFVINHLYPSVIAELVPTVEGFAFEPWFRSPLKPEASEWSYKFSRTPPGLRKEHQWTAEFKIGGTESITVKAGTCNAKKILREDTSNVGWKKYTYWYCPEIHSAVKAIIEWKNGTTYNLELIRYGSKTTEPLSALPPK